MPFPRPALATLLLVAASAAQAQDSWMRWPPRGETVPTAPAQTSARGDKVDLLLQRVGDHVDVLVNNPLAGPVQAVVSLERNGRSEDTAALVRAGTQARLERLPSTQEVNVQMRAIPGDPSARARQVDYRLPVPMKGMRIDQADGGRSSHSDDENRFAIDFAAPMGTAVTAARDGTVMDVESSQPDAVGANPDRRARPNYVRILHDDGSMGLYAHLQRGSVAVARGDKVGIGQRIGRVGNSGWSTAPHLHFTVQLNADRRLQSIPVRIMTPEGVLKLPK